MAEDIGYGPRLTTEEYRRRIVALYRDLPPMPSKEQDREIRKRELYLKIDHRLGTRFPLDRREQLWAIMQKVERRRIWLAAKYIIHYGLTRKHPLKSIHPKAERLAGFMVDEFSQVLSEKELSEFFGLEPGEKPGLPLDTGRR